MDAGDAGDGGRRRRSSVANQGLEDRVDGSVIVDDDRSTTTQGNDANGKVEQDVGDRADDSDAVRRSLRVIFFRLIALSPNTNIHFKKINI